MDWKPSGAKVWLKNSWVKNLEKIANRKNYDECKKFMNKHAVSIRDLEGITDLQKGKNKVTMEGCGYFDTYLQMMLKTRFLIIIGKESNIVNAKRGDGKKAWTKVRDEVRKFFKTAKKWYENMDADDSDCNCPYSSSDEEYDDYCSYQSLKI